MAKNTAVDGDNSISLDIGNNVGELEALRDLIFGNQARDFARRLGDLDGRLEAIRRELKSELDTRAQTATKMAADQTAALRKETGSRIDREVQSLAERIEQLSADIHEQMESSRRTLEARLDRMQDDTNERLRLMDQEGRQRDDELRTELLTVSGWLKDKMTARHDLGRMLEEVGQKLQVNAKGAGSGSNDAE